MDEGKDDALAELRRDVDRLEGKVDVLLTQEPSAEASGRRILQRVETFGKALGALAGATAASAFLFYLLGFVIVNLHLFRAGARDFELAKPSYLPAGITFAVVLGVVLGTSLLVAWVESPGMVRWKQARSLLLNLALCLVFAAGLLAFLAECRISMDFAAAVHDLLRCLTEKSSFLLSLALLFLLLFAPLYLRTEARPELDFRKLLYTLPALPIVGLTVIATWGVDIYGDISPSFGGGRPLHVRLVITDEKVQKELESDGLDFEVGVSPLLGLLDESKDYMLLRFAEDEPCRDSVRTHGSEVEKTELEDPHRQGHEAEPQVQAFRIRSSAVSTVQFLKCPEGL